MSNLHIYAGVWLFAIAAAAVLGYHRGRMQGRMLGRRQSWNELLQKLEGKINHARQILEIGKKAMERLEISLAVQEPAEGAIKQSLCQLDEMRVEGGWAESFELFQNQVLRAITIDMLPACVDGLVKNCLLEKAEGLGLVCEDITVGQGLQPHIGDELAAHYSVWLHPSKELIERSTDGDGPINFTLGAGRLIKGWEAGVATMRIGGRRRLIVPPELAYGGKEDNGPIPPNSTLEFEIELLEITTPDAFATG